MTEPIELRWSPRCGDFIEASLITAGRQLVAVPILVILCGVAVLALDKVTLGAFVIACGLAFPLLTVLAAVVAYRRNPLARAERHVVVGDDGLRMTAGHTRSDVGWPSVTEWRELSRWFVLRLGGPRPRQVALLRKRALTPEARTRLVTILTERVGTNGAGHSAQNGPVAVAEPVPATSPSTAGPPTGDAIELRWAPERADWREAFRAVSWFHRLLPWAGAAVAIGSVVWSAVTGCAPTGTGYRVNLGWVVFVPLGIVIACMPRRIVSGQFRRNPRMAARQEVTVGVNGVHVAGEFASQLEWAAFVGYLECRRSFVLRFGRTASTPVLLLAKRGVAAPHTVDDLRAMLERRLAPAPVTKRCRVAAREL